MAEEHTGPETEHRFSVAEFGGNGKRKFHLNSCFGHEEALQPENSFGLRLVYRTCKAQSLGWGTGRARSLNGLQAFRVFPSQHFALYYSLSLVSPVVNCASSRPSTDNETTATSCWVKLGPIGV